MANIPDPWNEFLRVEEMHKSLINLGLYILKQVGGLMWPFLYGWILYYSWDSLNFLGRVLFILAGIILTIIAILYPYSWKLFYIRMSKDYENLIEKNASDLFEAIRKQYSGFLTYGMYTREVKKMESSLGSFRRKYFSE
jgi:hypothetical protein